jgi:lysine decarboxylase
VAPDAVRATLAAHPGVRAVFLGDPTYVGTFGDVRAHADIAHEHGVPLIVDAAWAAHFGFHPDLPAHALAQGADALVSSAHKALPAYSQAALVLARTERIDAARLDAGVEATATTSPAAAILASIDAARALLERDGEELLTRTIAIVAEARERLAAEPGLRVVSGPHVEPTKLVVLFAGTGADGNLVADDLIAQGMMMELEDKDTMIAMVTMADDEATVDEFVTALLDSVRRHRGEPRGHVPSSSWLVDPDTVMSPREAFFAPHAVLDSRAAVGRISAELIAPYPPGVPVLAPGERITAEVIDMLRSARAAGTRIAYAADPTLETLRVVSSHDVLVTR